MTDALLCLVIMCNPVSMQANRTWDALSWEYRLPPISVKYAVLAGDDIAFSTNIPDGEGRAVITYDPRIPLSDVRHTTAHEAAHQMLRMEGVPYGGLYEERLANAFAFCWMNDDPYFLPPSDIPCDVAFGAFKDLHR